MRCAAATMSAPKTKLMDVFAPSGGYIQKTCTYIGGPKTGAWACR